LTLKAGKSLNFSDRPLFEAPVGGETLRIWWWNLASEN